MSATPADDAQTSPAWNCGCKDTKKFRTEQGEIDKMVDFLHLSVRIGKKW